MHSVLFSARITSVLVAEFRSKKARKGSVIMNVTEAWCRMTSLAVSETFFELEPNTVVQGWSYVGAVFVSECCLFVVSEEQCLYQIYVDELYGGLQKPNEDEKKK